MDPHSEHGESSPAPGSSSAPAADEPAATEVAGTEVTEPGIATPPDDAEASRASAEAREAGEAIPTSDPTPPGEPDPSDTLSPAVRRLVRQYDLDITGVYGTGPAGKIRVGDIIGMLDGRAEPRSRASEGAIPISIRGGDSGDRDAASHAPSDAGAAARETGQVSSQSSAAAAAAQAVPMTTVFECDVSRVLSHRKHERLGGADLLLASYFVAACLEPLSAVPEIAVGPAHSPQPESAETSPRLGVLLATTDGSVRRTLVTAAAASLNERLRAVDAQLRVSADDDLGAAQILIHHYGASGSLLATPTAIGAGHVGSIGIGRVRRAVVVKTVDGQEGPRVAALCYLTLTFHPERIALERANRFLGVWVRALELWPIEPATTVA